MTNISSNEENKITFIHSKKMYYIFYYLWFFCPRFLNYFGIHFKEIPP